MEDEMLRNCVWERYSNDLDMLSCNERTGLRSILCRLRYVGHVDNNW